MSDGAVQKFIQLLGEKFTKFMVADIQAMSPTVMEFKIEPGEKAVLEVSVERQGASDFCVRVSTDGAQRIHVISAAENTEVTPIDEVTPLGEPKLDPATAIRLAQADGKGDWSSLVEVDSKGGTA